MPSNQQLVVFSAPRSLLSIFSVFNSENLQGTRREIFVNICKMTGAVAMLPVVPMTMSFGIWYSALHKFNLNETAIAVSVILFGTQVYFSYLSLIMKNQQISSALNRLQDLVIERK